MLAQIVTQTGSKTIGYILDYQDPKYYELVNEIPLRTFFQENKTIAKCRGPLAKVIIPFKRNNELQFKIIICSLTIEQGIVYLQGFDDKGSRMFVRFEKLHDDNTRLFKEAHQVGHVNFFPALTISAPKARVSVQWITMDAKGISYASKYLAQLCVAVSMKTKMTLDALIKKSFVTIERVPWNYSIEQVRTLFWMFVPFPRPRSLQLWLNGSDKDDFNWKTIGPEVEGFHLISLELLSETEGTISFVGSKRPSVEVIVQQGGDDDIESLATKVFGSRARLCSPIQLAVAQKGEHILSSISWGYHSDHQRLRLLPYREGIDIGQFGFVRTTQLDHETLQRYESSPTLEFQEIYRKIESDAEALLSSISNM